LFSAVRVDPHKVEKLVSLLADLQLVAGRVPVDGQLRTRS
jgi:hypothetical protein